MFVSLLQAGLARFRGPLRRREHSAIASAAVLQSAIQVELDRYHRYGRRACLAIFMPALGRADQIPKLVHVLKRRIRTTDLVGELDSYRIAVLLPETSTQSARCFADAVLESLAERALSFDCEVLAYPTDRQAQVDRTSLRRGEERSKPGRAWA